MKNVIIDCLEEDKAALMFFLHLANYEVWIKELIVNVYENQVADLLEFIKNFFLATETDYNYTILEVPEVYQQNEPWLDFIYTP